MLSAAKAIHSACCAPYHCMAKKKNLLWSVGRKIFFSFFIPAVKLKATLINSRISSEKIPVRGSGVFVGERRNWGGRERADG